MLPCKVAEVALMSETEDVATIGLATLVTLTLSIAAGGFKSPPLSSFAQ